MRTTHELGALALGAWLALLGRAGAQAPAADPCPRPPPGSTVSEPEDLRRTFDEGGGYYDSGYVQPLDFFGDGTRIPLIAVSPYAKGGHISHDYTDHVSILKFIERNWGLAPVTTRSRDNFPNPVVNEDNPYVPLNTPAIGDLFDLFDFPAG